jgi:uncharacterized iron-regulated membrane protein
MTSTIKKIRRSLLLWHRRIGAVIAIFLLMLSITGLLLNHTDQLRLAEKPVSSEWWLSLYGVEHPEIVSYSVGQQWLSHMGGNNLYLNEQVIAFCEQPFLGAVELSSMVAAVCSDSLLLLTPSGELIERIENVMGMNQSIQGLAISAGELLMKANNSWYQVDSFSMQLSPYEGSAQLVQSQVLPKQLEQQLLQAFHGDDIHWERFMLDLHSGRLFGLSGVVWMDLVALSLIWVAGSGVWIWLTRPKR